MLLRNQVKVFASGEDSPGATSRATQKSKSRMLKSTATLAAVASLLSTPVLGSTTAQANERVLPSHSLSVQAPGSEESWADLRMETASEAGDLSENPGAASRARLREPAAVAACVASQGAANGSRVLTAQEVVYQPMVEGSYTTSSRFGGRIDPVFGTWRMHNGDDYSAPSGTPILAVAGGTVRDVGFDGSRGYYTEILHNMEDGSQVISAYFHQQAGSQLVSPGQEVQAGQQIGGVGSTGKSTGPHLHFEINDLAGNAVSPSAWLEAQGAFFVGKDCA